MSSEGTMRSFRYYLTVKQAAEFLGVSPDTLRNWDEAGKLRAIRHPVNRYRLYDPRTLEALLATAVEDRDSDVHECADRGRARIAAQR
jgi:excisionase family DNA binding protein